MCKGPVHCVAKLLVLIGGINWGLMGLQMLFADGSNWNVVNLLVGSWPTVEAVVYLLVGLSALWGAYMHFVCCHGGSCGAKK